MWLLLQEKEKMIDIPYIKIRDLLHQQKVSKTEFANYLGIARSTLNDYLTGRTLMTTDRIQQTAKFFNVTVSYLFNEETNDINEINKTLNNHQQQINELKTLIEQIKNK